MSQHSIKSLRIVADENIPFVEEFFGDLGAVQRFPGRTLSTEQLREADVLLVRSVTSVNRELLEQTPVRFVGTCTIGTDHLDLDYLGRAEIEVASAPGCNANAVVEYVFGVLARMRPDWQQARFGIIGCGNVGGALHRRLKDLGLTCACYDPFLDNASYPDLTELEVVLDCDVVCLHTPLTQSGSHPTFHLLGEPELEGLNSGTLLINAGRGAAIDNQALKRVLMRRHDLKVVLDVWEPEPLLDPDLLALVNGGSPHIAGYSYDGKVQGTAMIYQALCRFLDIEAEHSSAELLAADPSSCQPLVLRGDSAKDIINNALLDAFDVQEDDENLRATMTLSEEQRAQAFDQLRKTYRKRRECHSLEIGHWPNGLSADEKKSLYQQLTTLGFTLSMENPAG